MEFLVKADKWLVNVLEWLLIALFAIFLSLTCLLVFLRYMFSESILGADQIVTVAFIFTCAIGGAVGISKREHIAIPSGFRSVSISQSPSSSICFHARSRNGSTFSGSRSSR